MLSACGGQLDCISIIEQLHHLPDPRPSAADAEKYVFRGRVWKTGDAAD